MAFDQQLLISLNGQFAGQTVFNELFYASDSPNANVSSSQACDALYAIWTSDLQPLLHEDFTLTEIVAEIYGSSGTYSSPRYTRIVNEQGGVTTGDSMPPNVTAVIVKAPDNATLDPDTEPAFRNGRIGFSGIPEGQQDAGLIGSAFLASWNALGEELETLTLDPGGEDFDMDLGMWRAANTLVGGNPRANVYVAETYIRQNVGTQNTRKR